MESKKLRFIGIMIVIILTFTIGVQAFRTYQNYQLNQKQLQSDIQSALDNSIEAYFADQAKTDIITFTSGNLDDNKFLMKQLSPPGENSQFVHIDSIITKDIAKIKLSPNQLKEGDTIDGVKKIFIETINVSSDKISNIEIGKKLNSSEIENFARKIVISYTRDTLDFDKLNGLLQSELERQKIDVQYALTHYNREKITGGFGHHDLETFPFQTESKSTLLPPYQKVEMHFQNSALQVLQRGVTDLMISLLLLVVIAGALFYLYQAIKNQKELAEIKNDLINNITHEFKTPIATVASALEGIEHFNPANDAQKTQKYLDISNQQLFKLNTMVEKLLETATLDSEHLLLQKEQVDLLQLITNLSDKFQTMHPSKNILLDIPNNISPVLVDPFHLENALSNILDNALKYGGEIISVKVSQHTKTEISIADNGGNITSEQKDRVFDKFYRIPKGNVHDVKGFGIGLYYSKKIIEKHGGTITLLLSPGITTFKIILA